VLNNRETNRQAEIKELTSQGIVPHDKELEKYPEKSPEGRAWLMGRVSALIHDIQPAREIVDNMVSQAAMLLQQGGSMVQHKSFAKL
jgi:hypothetical protein